MYYNNRDVRVEEMPVPEIGDKDILVKVMACGICGSDIMEWYRIKKAPLVLGHELTGEIIEVEPGEAEWNLNILERLFDFYFVQPEISRKKRENLNKKLKDAGKPQMK